MKVKNVSGIDRYITPPNGDPIDAPAGAVIEVPDELGESLIEQDENWKKGTK